MCHAKIFLYFHMSLVKSPVLSIRLASELIRMPEGMFFPLGTISLRLFVSHATEQINEHRLMSLKDEI